MMKACSLGKKRLLAIFCSNSCSPLAPPPQAGDKGHPFSQHPPALGVVTIFILAILIDGQRGEIRVLGDG